MAKRNNSIEELARKIIEKASKGKADGFIPEMIRQEIGLTVDQIKRLRDQHEEQFRRLLQIECYIDTDLLQLQQRIPRYKSYHFPEKEKLKQRLFDIEKERRSLSLRLEEKTQGLEEKLLGLINKHALIDKQT